MRYFWLTLLVACAGNVVPLTDHMLDCRLRSRANGGDYLAALELCLRDGHHWNPSDVAAALADERVGQETRRLVLSADPTGSRAQALDLSEDSIFRASPGKQLHWSR